MKNVLLGLIGLVILSGLAYFFLYSSNQTNRLTGIPSANQNSRSENINLEIIPPISTIAENLTVPWAMDFLPDGRMIFTERPGNVKLIEENSDITQIATIDVYEVSESGLHGVAVDPDFESNNYIYLYYTYRNAGQNTLNRVSRFAFQNNSLNNEQVIVDEIPGAPNHDGGRIKFGPDGYLYITTGDAQEPTLAQDRGSLAGKILRVTRAGGAAPGNPFGTRIYSYGHRNPQGITWDNDGNLWSTEHGRSGVQSGLDELNIIEAGKNYGWPEIQGDETRSGMETPILQSGAATTWAPGGTAFLGGSIFFTGLRGQALYEYKINKRSLSEHLAGQLGRIRDVIAGPDGLLYIATSNRDGRGQPTSDDDRILRINPSKLEQL